MYALTSFIIIITFKKIVIIYIVRHIGRLFFEDDICNHIYFSLKFISEKEHKCLCVCNKEIYCLTFFCRTVNFNICFVWKIKMILENKIMYEKR